MILPLQLAKSDKQSSHVPYRRLSGTFLDIAAGRNTAGHERVQAARTIDTPWSLGRVPDGYWDLHKNRLHYMNWLGALLGFRDPEDWYAVHRRDFLRNHGGGLFRICYGSSPYMALLDYRPDFDWKPWLFGGAPSRYWHDVENRRTYLRWLGRRLGFTKPDDWYVVTRSHFAEHSGAGLLNNQYHGQTHKAVRELYPDHPWLEWLFANVSRGYWHSSANRHCFMNWMGKQLNYTEPEHWYGVRRVDFERFGGSGLLVGLYAGSIYRALVDFQPEYPWDANVLKRHRPAKTPDAPVPQTA